jgi:hypothetical protein
MKAILTICLLVPVFANAGPIGRVQTAGGGGVTFYDEPCKDARINTTGHKVITFSRSSKEMLHGCSVLIDDVVYVLWREVSGTSYYQSKDIDWRKK